MSLVVFGSINVDVVTYGDRVPGPGETLHGESYAISLGGKGANQAVSLARLGVETHLAGRLGADAFGAMARERLTYFGVDLTHVRTDEGHPTGIAVIQVERGGENRITVIGAANMAINGDDVDRLGPLLGRTQGLLLQMEIPLAPALEAARRVRSQGGFVLLDPAPAPKTELPPEVWGAVDGVTPNETETEALVGIRPTDAESAAQAARALTDRGVSMAVVKMGAKGVVWRDRDGTEGYQPAFPVEAIDTVAAGDCFSGGLARSLAAGRSLAEAVRFASACGALATTRRGASDAAPSRAEVEHFLGRDG
ncbi:MAG: ribokinase [Rhodospirillum sp.]|nr:ribokinase [Rhodospirillum sp.]MCF8491327.1 ribokinase [Rhodospirillum sp.]